MAGFYDPAFGRENPWDRPKNQQFGQGQSTQRRISPPRSIFAGARASGPGGTRRQPQQLPFDIEAIKDAALRSSGAVKGRALATGIGNSAVGLLEQLTGASAPMFQGNLADYLARAGDGSNLITSQLSALDAERQRGKDNQARGDSDIEAMYRALKADMLKEQAATKSRYEDANQDSINSSQAANDAIQQALQNAQGSQAETFKNLGISDAGKQAAATQSDYSTQNTARTATQADAARQALTAQGAAQGDLLAANASAAGFRGNERRADLLSELQAYLAQLGMQEAQLRDSAAQQARQQAMEQFQSDQDSWYRNQEFQQGLDDRAYERGMDRYNLDLQQQQMQAEAAQAGAPQVDNKGGIQNAQNYIASLGFRDPATNSHILNGIQQAWADTNALDANSRFQQALENLKVMFGQGDGTQYRAAVNALAAYLGSSGILK